MGKFKIDIALNDFPSILSNSAVTILLVTALLESIDQMFIINVANFSGVAATH